MSSTATASRSISRSTVGSRQLVRLLAQPLARLLGDRQRVGHLAHVLDEQQVAEVLEQVGDEPAEILALLGELLDEDERAGGVAVDDVSQRRKSASSSTAPSSWSTDCTVICCSVAAASWSSVDTASRNEPRAPRAISASAASGASIALAVADAPQHGARARAARPLEDERLAARADGGQHLGELGRAEDEDEVGRRLLDQLQQRVPGGVRELVRLVEDVDLVAALGRLEDDALADLADVVDPALRRGVHLDHVERGRRSRSRRRRGRCCPASVVGPCAQFSAFARIRAIDVLPVPRGPAKRYACRTWSQLDRVAQRADDCLLPDDLVEVLRAVLPVERSHRCDSSRAEPGRAARRRSWPTGGIYVACSGRAEPQHLGGDP